MNRLIATAVLIFFFTASFAHANDKGPYFSGNLGLSILSDSDTNLPGFFNAEVTFDPGFMLGGALGYDFGTFRVEGEIAYRLNDTDEGTIVGIPGSGPVTGDVSALSVMANGYYDFHPANSPVVPYLGLGIGFANVTADVTAPNISTLALIDDSTIVFAYQIMAGIGYKISPVTTFTADYRYFRTSDPEFETGPAFIPGLPDFETEYNNHSFNVGVRHSF